MATYLNPKVFTELESLLGSGTSNIKSRYNHYRSLANHLVGVYDRLIYKVAVVVDEWEEFQEFEGQYKLGLFVERKYYSVSQEFIEQHKVKNNE